MAGKVVIFKVCSPVKLRSGLTGKHYAICHYSYNLPFPLLTYLLSHSQTHHPIPTTKKTRQTLQ